MSSSLEIYVGPCMVIPHVQKEHITRKILCPHKHFGREKSEGHKYCPSCGTKTIMEEFSKIEIVNGWQLLPEEYHDVLSYATDEDECSIFIPNCTYGRLHDNDSFDLTTVNINGGIDWFVDNHKRILLSMQEYNPAVKFLVVSWWW